MFKSLLTAILENKLEGEVGDIVSLQAKTSFSAEGQVKMYRTYRQK